MNTRRVKRKKSSTEHDEDPSSVASFEKKIHFDKSILQTRSILSGSKDVTVGNNTKDDNSGSPRDNHIASTENDNSNSDFPSCSNVQTRNILSGSIDVTIDNNTTLSDFIKDDNSGSPRDNNIASTENDNSNSDFPSCSNVQTTNILSGSIDVTIDNNTTDDNSGSSRDNNIASTENDNSNSDLSSTISTIRGANASSDSNIEVDNSGESSFVVDPGEGDFAVVRHFPGYQDKSNLIRTVVNGKSRLLILAPRRFCKSVNLTMMMRFFEMCNDEAEKEENRKLFEGLVINNYPRIIDAHFAKYPVIYLNFAVNGPIRTYDEAFSHVLGVVHEAYVKHAYLQHSDKIEDKSYIKKWCHEDQYKRTDIDECDPELKKRFASYVTSALKNLAKFLRTHHNVKGVHLYVDEYDSVCSKSIFHVKDEIDEKTGKTKIPANKIFESIVELCIGAIGCLAKNNVNVSRAVVTGISFIMTKGLSNLNNFEVNRFQEKHAYSEYYGLTTDEVKNVLLPKFNLTTKFDIISNFYNGYRNGMYSVLSVTEYINRFLRSATTEPQNFWSESGLILNFDEALHLPCVKTVILRLLLGDSSVVRMKYIKTLTFKMLWELKEILLNQNPNLENPDLFLNFLLEQGYLAIVNIITRGTEVEVRIPNEEIRGEFREKLIDFFKKNHRLNTELVMECAAVFDNLIVDLKKMDEQLRTIFNLLNEIFISLEIPSKNEATCHHFVFFVAYFCYNFKCFSEVKSSFTTRKILDLCLINLERKIGIVIELKYNKTPREALDQILEKKYYNAFTHNKYNPDEIKMECEIFIGLNVSCEQEISMSVLVNSRKIEDEIEFK